MLQVEFGFAGFGFAGGLYVTEWCGYGSGCCVSWVWCGTRFRACGLWVIVVVVACCVLVSLVFGVFLCGGVCAE